MVFDAYTQFEESVLTAKMRMAEVRMYAKDFRHLQCNCTSALAWHVGRVAQRVVFVHRTC